jgi:flagella basal body P-ring formation protein FlgA
VLDRRNLEINLPANIGIPNIQIVDVTYNPTDYRFKGTLLAETETTQDEPFMLAVTGRAIPNVNIPILSQRLSEGAIISEADIETLILPVNKVTPDTITSTRELVGKEVRRELGEGSMVRSRDIRPQQLVKRGRIVTMVIERGPLRVTAQGRAMGDGGAGDNVRVLNNISNRVIEGTILNDGTVAIAAGA